LLGRVDYDETRLRTVTSWIGGRIDRLHVRTTGQRVGRGQVVATLYSPEVFSAHQDLLVAAAQKKKLAGATEGARFGADAALRAARDRLRLLGIPAPEIDSMASAARPSEQVKVRSPFAGTIIERLATEGSYVQTGTGLYQISDLSRLWVQLDAYESDLPLLAVGQDVSLKVEALPAEIFEGRVTFVDPVLNAQTRTTRVRIEVQNPDGKLRPNMCAKAVVQGKGNSGERDAPASDLMIPDTAPLFTGRRSVVYVEIPGMDSPTYEARVVRLGPKMGDVYPVLDGLREGERVVIHGAFTLDADLQIRGGRSMMAMQGDAEAVEVEVPEAHRAQLGGIVERYLELQQALSSDDLPRARSAAEALGKAAEELEVPTTSAFGGEWLPLRTQLLDGATRLAAAPAIGDARVAFEVLSAQVATLIRIFGNPTTKTVHLAFCPMAADGAGVEWVQEASEVQNPYFGESMYSCGDVLSVAEEGEHLSGAIHAEPTAPGAHGGHQH